MSWFSSITLRFFIGSITGLAISLAISYWGLSDTIQATNPIDPMILLISPVVLMILLGFLIPSLIVNSRWKRRWLELATGKKECAPDKREKLVLKGLAELTSVWLFPPISRKYVRVYTSEWSKTLLKIRCADVWTWDLHAMAWYVIKEDPESLENMRSLLMETGTLCDAAFDVGLSLLGENELDIELAILLSRESLDKNLEYLDTDRITLLENAWLAAYVKDEETGDKHLQRLKNRFLDTGRRDEVAGRIYLDAFISGERETRLLNEMSIVADLLSKTGRYPEMTANLRALANSVAGNEIDSVIKDTVSSNPGLSFAQPEIKSNVIPKQSDSPDKEEKKILEKVYSANAPIKIAPMSTTPKPKKKSVQVKRSYKWLKPVLISLLIVIIGVAGWYYGYPLITEYLSEVQIVENVQPPLSKHGAVKSDKPFTVQVAALPTREAAFRKLSELRVDNIDAYYVLTKRGETSWYRLRFGQYDTTRDAQTVADSLKRAGLIDEYFVATFEPGEIPKEVE
jgi:SPOR domain